MVTAIYVDALNLYYGKFKKHDCKWVNLKTLFDLVLQPHHTADIIKFYYAIVSGKLDPDAPSRQQKYLNALETIQDCDFQFHQSKFKVDVKRRPRYPITDPIQYIDVLWPEEKRTDVTLAAQLVHDAHKNVFDTAFIVSNDTDLYEPIRIVKHELNKKVGIIQTFDTCATSLMGLNLDYYREVSLSKIKKSVFSDVITVAGRRKPIIKPESW